MDMKVVSTPMWKLAPRDNSNTEKLGAEPVACCELED